MRAWLCMLVMLMATPAWAGPRVASSDALPKVDADSSDRAPLTHPAPAPKAKRAAPTRLGTRAPAPNGARVKGLRATTQTVALADVPTGARPGALSERPHPHQVASAQPPQDVARGSAPVASASSSSQGASHGDTVADASVTSRVLALLAANQSLASDDLVNSDLTSDDTARAMRGKPWRPKPGVPGKDSFEELALELLLGGQTILPDLLGLQRGQVAWVPLGPVIEALEFPIAVDVQAGTAIGWFIEESRRFELDVSQRTVKVGTKARRIDPEHVIWRDELYIRLDTLCDWLGMTPKLDLGAMRLNLLTADRLPAQRRAERALKHRLLAARTRPPSGPATTMAGPGLAGAPRVDVRATAATPGPGPGSVGLKPTVGASTYSVGGQGDLLWMESDWQVAGTANDALSLARIRLSRRDPQGNLLGPLGAREVVVGDFATASIPLVARGQQSRGVAVSSYPLTSPTEFDKTRLEGELPVGWEAELFRNGALLAFTSSTSGRYAFEDIPLQFGRNELLVVLHGPYGERREVAQDVLVGSGMVKPGEVRYSASLSQDRETVLPIGYQVTGPNTGQTRVLGRVEGGLTRQLSLFGAASSQANQEGERNGYGSLGLRGVLGPFLAQADVAAQLDGKMAGHIGAQTRLGSATLVAEHAAFNPGFTGETSGMVNDLASRSKLRLDGPVGLGRLGNLGLGLDTEMDLVEQGGTRARASARASWSVASFSVATAVQAVAEDFADWNLYGSTMTRYRTGLITPRATVTWRQQGTFVGLEEVSGGLDVRLAATTAAQLDVRHVLGSNDTIARLGFTQRGLRMIWGAQVGYGVDYGLSAVLTLESHLGLGAEPSLWQASSTAAGPTGSASVRVFFDRDGDGKFSAGDEPIEGARFRLGLTQTPVATTDGEGRATIPRLPAYRQVEIYLDRSSLPDTYALPKPEFISVLPRVGGTIDLEFPVTQAGAIEGTVTRLTAAGTEEAPGIEIELVSAKEVVARQTTAYDGFYIFEDVVPGSYQMRVAAASVPDGAGAPAPKQVVIGAEGTVLSGIDFELTSADLMLPGEVKPAPRPVPTPVVAPPVVVEPPRVQAPVTPAPSTPAPVQAAPTPPAEAPVPDPAAPKPTAPPRPDGPAEHGTADPQFLPADEGAPSGPAVEPQPTPPPVVPPPIEAPSVTPPQPVAPAPVPPKAVAPPRAPAPQPSVAAPKAVPQPPRLRGKNGRVAAKTFGPGGKPMVWRSVSRLAPPPPVLAPVGQLFQQARIESRAVKKWLDDSLESLSEVGRRLKSAWPLPSAAAPKPIPVPPSPRTKLKK